MKKFDEIFVQSNGTASRQAMRFAAAGFGIVPGLGWTRSGDSWRIATRKLGEDGGPDRPEFGLDAVSDIMSMSDDCPFYVALAGVGESADDDGMLTVIDLDNGHGERGQVAVDVLWERFMSLCESLDISEDEMKTIVVETPNAGLHLYFRDDMAGLFKWVTGITSDILGDEIALDWLTPGGHQHITGPGSCRPMADGGCRSYRLMLPAGHEDDDLSQVLKPLPLPLLRWLISQHVSRKSSPEMCFRSRIGYDKARKMKSIADLVKVSKKPQASSQATSCGQVGLYSSQNVAESGSRHNACVSFAGLAIKKCTAGDFEATKALIASEIEAFGTRRCSPPLPHEEIASITRDAMIWAEQARDEIESRIASQVVVVGADGQRTTQVVADFVMREVHGATYRCRPRKNGAPGMPACSPSNVVAALEHDDGLRGCFGYDELAVRNCIVKPLPWSRPDEKFPRFVTDADLGRLTTYIDEVAHFDPTRNLRSAFNEVCSRHSFNPLVDFVRGFDGQWDGEDHIEHLLSRWMGAEHDVVNGHSFSGAVMKLWMRGAVRRALHPGCKLDSVVLLTGDQGIGKSTFWARLAMRDEWFCESLADISDKKAAFEQISGSWLVCIDELSALRSMKDVTRIKSYLTSCYDDYRAPYKQERERIPRRVAFCGTSNELTFLADRSGNRRFIVIPCAGVVEDDGRPKLFSDPEFMEDVRQCWAQAYAMELAAPDEPLVLPMWAQIVQEARNDDASIADPLDEKLIALLSDSDVRMKTDALSYEQIYASVYECEPADYMRDRHLKSFQDAVKRVAAKTGWEYGRFSSRWGATSGKKTQRRGFAPILTEDEKRTVSQKLMAQCEDKLIDMRQLALAG